METPIFSCFVRMPEFYRKTRHQNPRAPQRFGVGSRFSLGQHARLMKVFFCLAILHFFRARKTKLKKKVFTCIPLKPATASTSVCVQSEKKNYNNSSYEQQCSTHKN